MGLVRCSPRGGWNIANTIDSTAIPGIYATKLSMMRFNTLHVDRHGKREGLFNTACRSPWTGRVHGPVTGC